MNGGFDGFQWQYFIQWNRLAVFEQAFDINFNSFFGAFASFFEGVTTYPPSSAGSKSTV